MDLACRGGVVDRAVGHPQFAPEVYLEGETTRQSMLSREHHEPRTVLNATERLSAALIVWPRCSRVEAQPMMCVLARYGGRRL